MNLSNFGATCRTLLFAVALASLAVPSSAQIVERSRTLADLLSSHPCTSGLAGRHTIVTDCDAADDLGDGEGAFSCFARCDGIDTWAAVAIGAGGGGLPGADEVTESMLKVVNACTDEYVLTCETTTGDFEWQAASGAATSVSGSATLPATCTEKDLYQDTDSGGTEFYVCTATNTWTKAGAGDVVGPASSTANAVPQFSGTGGKTLIESVYKLDSGYFVKSNGGVGGLLNALSGSSSGLIIGDFNAGGDKGYMSFQVNGAGGVLGIEDRATNDYRLGLKATAGICWVPSGFGYDTENCNVGFVYVAPGIATVSNGTPSGLGWLPQDGQKALAADFTSTSATPADLTGLTVTLKTGREYTFRFVARFSDSTAADGARFDFDGGTATATDFGVNCQVYDSTLLHVLDTTALATDLVATTTTGASSIKCDGSFTVNAAGTFIVRAGQEAASGGTLTVETGSFLHVTDTSFN